MRILTGSVTLGSGAIGRVAADKYEPLTYRSNLNLQFGMVAAQPDDIFLLASDGLWDTLDPVQARQTCITAYQTSQNLRTAAQSANPG